jgi:hypothetical protein
MLGGLKLFGILADNLEKFDPSDRCGRRKRQEQ